ncbi:MAG: hypothetical protein WBO37_03605 [Gammaproteobacteria bacterium]
MIDFNITDADALGRAGLPAGESNPTALDPDNGNPGIAEVTDTTITIIDSRQIDGHMKLALRLCNNPPFLIAPEGELPHPCLDHLSCLSVCATRAPSGVPTSSRSLH